MQRVGHDQNNPERIDQVFFWPVAGLPQCELSMKVLRIISAAGVMALSESFFEPLVAGDQKAPLASLSL